MKFICDAATQQKPSVQRLASAFRSIGVPVTFEATQVSPQLPIMLTVDDVPDEEVVAKWLITKG